MLGNVLIYVAVVFTPPLLVLLALRLRHVIAERIDARRVRGHQRPPIERLSADLRRLHRYLINLPEDAPAVRRTAAEQAYDALLSEACQVLDVDHELTAKASRMDRDLERLRVEDALQTAGLRIR